MAAGEMFPGGSLNSVPLTQKQTLADNYIDFTSADTKGWAQQYLPDLMEAEAEVFGNRTIGGFLEMVGAEEPMSSDQVIWSEQGRLHLAYQANVKEATGGYDVTITKDIDGNDIAGKAGVRVGDLILLSEAGSKNKVVKAYVTAVAVVTISAKDTVKVTCKTLDGSQPLTNTATATNNGVNVKLFVYGSEYGKGSSGRTEALEPQFKSFTNQPIIMKDMYEVSGSDASQIGWVEVSGEDGQSGYMWYLKAAGDTRMRFADYCEMMLVEHELVDTDSGTAGAQTITGHAASTTTPGSNATAGGTIKGTEGMFAAITSRGNVFDGLDTSQTAAEVLTDFDTILKEFDTQGAIEEYMIFGNRDLMLTIDDMLAGQNSYGGGGTSYGVFDNDEDMALNLGFSGFRRGSYDFYKSDWKYLNDVSTRGGVVGTANVRGVFVPAGVTSVYDQQLGKNLKRPFLHCRYRASQMEDRRFKTWTTGSVGAATSDLDAMHMHFLTERCLITQGANNFMLIKGTTA